MADHARTQIVDAFVAALTGLATTGARVADSPVYPSEPADLPALRIYWDAETTAPGTIHGMTENRLQVSVAGVAASNDELRGTLDQICKEVQIAMSTDPPTIGGKVHITRTGANAQRDAAGQPTGIVITSYEALYFTAENAPDVLY